MLKLVRVFWMLFGLELFSVLKLCCALMLTLFCFDSSDI